MASQVPQGSVATYVKCGGKHDKFLSESNGERILKSINEGQSYSRMKSGMFFDSQCIIKPSFKWRDYTQNAQLVLKSLISLIGLSKCDSLPATIIVISQRFLIFKK